MPSLFAERVSLNFPPAFDAVGVTGVEGVAAADELAAFLAAGTRRDEEVDVDVCVKKGRTWWLGPALPSRCMLFPLNFRFPLLDNLLRELRDLL